MEFVGEGIPPTPQRGTTKRELNLETMAACQVEVEITRKIVTDHGIFCRTHATASCSCEQPHVARTGPVGTHVSASSHRELVKYALIVSSNVAASVASLDFFFELALAAFFCRFRVAGVLGTDALEILPIISLLMF